MTIEEYTRSAPEDELMLGDRRFDVTHRAVVMGILNRTADSFYDRGAYFTLDAFLRRAEGLVADGADVLDVGGRKAGIGGDDVSPSEETDRVVASILALRERFDVPLSVDTWRASVAAAAFEAGAVVGNDISGFADAEYLEVAASAGASVVATHIRLPPRVPDPDPVYGDVVLDVATALTRLAGRAESAGIRRQRIMLDPGLDLGKTWQQSLRLLRESAAFVELGYPVLVAPSNKIFLGRALGLDIHERGHATVAACALAVTRGCRILRVHDARAARTAADLLAAALSAG